MIKLGSVSKPLVNLQVLAKTSEGFVFFIVSVTDPENFERMLLYFPYLFSFL